MAQCVFTYAQGTRLTGISQAPLYYKCIVFYMYNMLFAHLGPTEKLIHILFYVVVVLCTCSSDVSLLTNVHAQRIDVVEDSDHSKPL